jgi:very-short-patch-repair endonuclease
MIELLDSWKVKYEFQKIFYIKSKGGFIKQYYIADFYIPKKHLIIEVDGKFHKDQVAFDEFRTKNIQKHYPKITVARWEYKDFSIVNSLKQLREIVGGK